MVVQGHVFKPKEELRFLLLMKAHISCSYLCVHYPNDVASCFVLGFVKKNLN